MERFGKNTAGRIKGSGLYCFVSGGCTLPSPMKTIHQGYFQCCCEMSKKWETCPLQAESRQLCGIKLSRSVTSPDSSQSSVNTHDSACLLLLKKGSFLEKHDHFCPAGWVLSVLRRWGLSCSEQQQQNLSVWWTWDSLPEDSFPLRAGFVFSFPGSCSLFEACLTSSFWFFSF